MRTAAASRQDPLLWIPPLEPQWSVVPRDARAPYIGCVLSDRLFQGLQFDASLFLLTDENWPDALTEIPMDFILLESGPRIMEGLWPESAQEASAKPDFLLSLASSALERSIPVVLWFTGRAEHVGLSRELMRLSNRVFASTTDAVLSCDALGQKASLLEPAFQPARHRPTPLQPLPSRTTVFLADARGRFSLPRRSPERKRLQRIMKKNRDIPILNVGLEEQLTVADRRKFGAFAGSLLGTVPKCFLDDLYRCFDFRLLCAFGAETNSGDGGWDTLEAVASLCLPLKIGTPNWSNISDRIAPPTSEAAFEKEIKALLRAAPEDTRKRAQNVWRWLHNNHTFRHRLVRIYQSLGLSKAQGFAYPTSISLYAVVETAEQVLEALKSFDRIRFSHMELILIAPQPFDIQLVARKHPPNVRSAKFNGDPQSEIVAQARGDLLIPLDRVSSDEFALQNLVYELRGLSDCGDSGLLPTDGPSTAELLRDGSGRPAGYIKELRHQAGLPKEHPEGCKWNDFLKQMDETLVTVVVPIYNKEHFLPKTLQTILGQTHRNLEIILVDDGSSDGSYAIMDAFQKTDPRIRLIRQENQGLSGARNSGIRAATGSYVTFFDADDLLLESAVGRLLMVALHDQADVVAGVHERMIDSDVRTRPRKKIGKKRNRKKSIRREFLVWNRSVNFRSDTHLFPIYRSHISSCNKLYRRRFLEEHDLQFVPGLHVEDLEFWLRSSFLAERISFTPFVHSRYFVRSSGLSQLRSLDRFESIREIWQRLDLFYDVHGLGDYEKFRDEAILSAAVLFFVRWFMDEFQRPEVQEKLDELAEILKCRPIGHFDEFCKTPIGPVLLAMREGDHRLARKLYFSQEGTQAKLKLLQSEHGPNLQSRIVAKAFDIDAKGGIHKDGSCDL